MQGFVNRQRIGSPASGQAQGKPDRQANAANAKIPIVNGRPVQQSQALPDVPVRGRNNAQNSSAVLQQPLQHRQSGLGPSQKRDPYDTDAESLDTTVNISTVQVEDSQQKEQHHQQQQDYTLDHEESSGTGGEENEDEEFEERSDGPEDRYKYEDYELTYDEEEYFRNLKLGHLSRKEKLHFLQEAAPAGFRTVDGDSYPSTTNGEPSEWGFGQNVPSNLHNDAAPVSPPPQRQFMNSEAARIAQSHPPQRQQRQHLPTASQNIQRTSELYHHAGQLREQSRAVAPSFQHPGQSFQQNAAILPVINHQTHPRTEPKVTANLTLHSNHNPVTHVQPKRSQQDPVRQSSGPRTQLPPKENTMFVAPHTHSKRQPLVPTIQEPVIPQQPVEQAPIEELEPVSAEDYDDKTLSKMSYEELKNESFDTNPRVRLSVLTEEELQKPLVERLEFVQHNLDASEQSEFFRSLPTTEWEDAGDWFLDQFQSIINRTKEARQKKRKLAQGLELEVEKRYEHVSKKQCQVQQAMDKMKAQGEGLVPRSPRSSKSPRGKRS
jgi:hypothetical protein